MANDYYETLGVRRDASEKDIRAAFRKLARRHHPDVNPGDPGAEARFKEINEAYQTLSDADSRKKYDRYGDGWRNVDHARADARSGPSPHVWFANARSGGARAGGPAPGVDLGGFGGIFGDLFGGGAPHGAGPFGGAMRGMAEVETRATISLEEAYRGAARFVDASPVGGNPRLQARIPAGVESGARIRVDANGAGASVTLVVTVAPHPVFTRDGDNLRITADVPLVDAALGGEVAAPLITGKSVALKIPAETQNGRVFRLRGKGMPRRGGNGYGDLLVTARVVLPTGLSGEERALFERLRDARSPRPQAQAGSPR